MSVSDFNLNSASSNSLINRILEQGQRLRNSMVQTILNNDPFNKEFINCNSPRPKLELKIGKKDQKQFEDGDYMRLHKYLRGDEMCLNEEVKALETLQIMSPNAIIQSTSVLQNFCHCKDSCDICNEYENKLLPSTTTICSKKPKCSENASKTSLSNISLPNSKIRAIKQTFSENQNLLKYVDSLKINVYSLKLNNAGNRKLDASDKVTKFTFISSVTYFVEYNLPDILTKNVFKSRAKVNSGLDPNKVIRFCSKKLQNQSVYFKQQSVHLISNVDLVDLSNMKIEFRISFRSVKDRCPVLIGKANFNLGFLSTNKFFTSEQELVVMNDNAPVVLGKLKVALQFGCEKLYFGKEFIDAISCSKENTNLSDTDSIHKLADQEHSPKKKVLVPNENQNNIEISSPVVAPIPKPFDSYLLYTLIFISEVRLLSEPLNTYLICNGFNKDDTITSRTIYNEYKPNFNLYQIIPVLIDENFVQRLRDNYIICEVWEKANVDNLLGIAKLSLHQFYLTYRNPLIAKHLIQNKNPVIGVDWWEPITNPIIQSEIGQLKAIVALGSLGQIENLENSRNLKSFLDTIPEKFQTINDNPKVLGENKTSNDKPNLDEEKNALDEFHVSVKQSVVIPDTEDTISLINKSAQTIEEGKVDAATQSDMTTERKPESRNEFLNYFLDQILTARNLSQKNQQVENSTDTNDLVSESVKNTEEKPSQTSVQIDSNMNFNNSTNVSNLTVRNTSDLLDSLQRALNLGPPNEKATEFDINNSFKAHIVIESALHLPSRKKCKAKRNKSKTAKNEEIFPSTYVTFKGCNENDTITTFVVPKNTNPKWDFRCDVNLPSELLLNDQKRLIFKVWKKANGPSLQPNFQTDIVLGFAAVDLTVLLSGLPNIQGWFNIMDFSSKCNGQLKILVTPLENLYKYNDYKRSYIPEKLPVKPPTLNVELPEIAKPEPETENLPSELFSRALKRKFTELDEITQRLRQRLTVVTNDDSDVSNDEFVEQFERDLNTTVVETEPFHFPMELLLDDVDVPTSSKGNCANLLTVASEKGSSSSSTTSSAKVPTVQENLSKLDAHLNEGKIKIDSLLQKLSLLTADNVEQNTDRSFSNRYVSGCSVSQEQETETYDPKTYFHPDSIFNPYIFQQIFANSTDCGPPLEYSTLKNLVNDSVSSESLKDFDSVSSLSLSDSHDVRQAPDGSGNLSKD